MITLITGVPGAGKSLKAVEIVQAALKEGRAVYSDIDGHSPPGVLPSPSDWRDTPEGSLVVYDEAQKTYPSTGKPGVSDDDRIRALEVHRHTGHDIVFITQSPSLVHHHIRKLVGRHLHVHRAAGLKRATIFTWDFAVSNPNDRNEQARGDTENWQYPKDLFKYYKSATVHTHKFHVPKKIAFALGAIALVASFVGYRAYAAGGLEVLNLAKHDAPASEARSDAEHAAPPLSPNGSLWASAEPLPSIAGCAVLTHSCRCWNGDGAQLNLNEGDCLTLAKSPIPINFSEFKTRKKSASGPRSSPSVRSAGVSTVGPSS